MNTYECEICNGINHVAKFHCQYCNTVPSHYSFMSQPITPRVTIDSITLYYIQVFVAFGASRQASRRTIKRSIRTVPLDYYASV